MKRKMVTSKIQLTTKTPEDVDAYSDNFDSDEDLTRQASTAALRTVAP